MARKRDPRRDEAFEIWKKHKGEITNREIAQQLDVPEKTISSWKSRDKWNAVLQNNERSTTNEKRSTSNSKKKKSTSNGQKNRSGNPNPKNQFTKRNSLAVKHGLFAKYLPDETLEIFNEIDSITPIDILWMNIKMQFASIMRAQQIMFVNDVDDMTKEVRKEIDSVDFETKEYEIQFAWDKQANFLNSQSRAMAELRNMLKQFSEMAHEDDDRLLEVKRIEASIVKTEKETQFIEERTKQIKGEKKDTSMLDALIEGRKQYEQMMKERENNE